MGDPTVKQTLATAVTESQEHITRTIENDSETILTGHYLSFRIHRLAVNAECVNSCNGEVRLFTLMEIELQNLSDHLLAALRGGLSNSLKMIDTEGYQHNSDTPSFWRYTPKFAGWRTEEVDLPTPDGELDAGTRTRGWVYFDALPKDVFPARIIKRTEIYDPGHTSGWVRHVEILEFIIPKPDIVTQLRLLQP